jgi:haloalkane dehalogenase
MSTPARRRATSVLPAEITASRELLSQIERELPKLTGLPALIVWADRDIAFRAKEREHWEAILADHRTVILRGAGHYLQSDAPEEFAQALSGWHASRAA